MVYVIDMNDNPLMPCENVVARLLLKSKKAKVLKKCPFTIKLLNETTSYTQSITEKCEKPTPLGVGWIARKC